LTAPTADPAPTRPAPRAWLAVATAGAVGAVVALALPSAALDWRPERALAEPWRWWTAAWVHFSPLHLAANLAALAVVTAFGFAAAVPRSAAIAWAAAWPLTQLGLLAQPALTRYGGLSGVLHAGVACVVTTLLLDARGARRAIGAAVGTGLVVKLLSETPWAGPLTRSPEWDIPIAPLAHATGAVAGTVCTIAVRAWATVRRPPR
jgi:rhomboid family GlyGly-CTERM serine protease